MAAAVLPTLASDTMHPTGMTPPPIPPWPTSNSRVDENDAFSPLHRRTTRSLSFSHSALRPSSASSSAVLSFEEYDRLPSSIKRKFFTSTERLHIAQQPEMKHRRRKLSLGQARPSSPMYNERVRPATSGGVTRRGSRRKSVAPTPAFTDLQSDDITEEQAHWYLDLPDKIRKRQFSRREQITFALQCKRALEITAPESAQDALRRCLRLGREEALSAANKRRRRSSAVTVDTDILLDEEEQSQPGSPNVRSDSLMDDKDPANGHSSPVIRSSKSMVDVSRPASSSPTPTVRQSASLRRKSHGHLTPLPLPPPQLAPALPLFHAPVGAPQTPSPPSSVQMQPTEPEATLSDPRPSSAHHNQPHVRQQLRQWLSPEKFDEALTYGFSFSNAETSSFSPAMKQQSTSTQPPPLYHADDDWSEDNDLGPMTPTAVPENVLPTGKKPSFDSSANLSLRSNLFSLSKNHRKHGPVESLGEREMTVRITLTRRNVRDAGGPTYGVDALQSSAGLVDVERVDPLALEAITVCDDPTGAHGAFAVSTTSSSKGFKKVWRALKKL